MEIGATPASPSEEVLLRIQIQIAVSRRKKIDRDWHYDLQSPFWRLYVNNRSGATITYEEQTIALKPNRVYLIPAWVHFLAASTRAITQDYMHFYVTGLPPTLLRSVFDRPVLLPRDSILDGLCHRWRDGFVSNLTFAKLGWATSLAYAAMAAATDNLSETTQLAFFNSCTEFSTIGPALECIDNRLSNPPTNPELAQLCNLSTDLFIRQFRLIVGITPAQYGLERRIALAAKWLTATSRTLEEIAADAGFTDRFHFTRVFKARLGMPPVAYRRSHQMPHD